MMLSEIIPEQLIGGKSTSISLSIEKDAIDFCDIAVKRLLQINSWENLCGNDSPHFKFFRNGLPENQWKTINRRDFKNSD